MHQSTPDALSQTVAFSAAAYMPIAYGFTVADIAYRPVKVLYDGNTRYRWRPYLVPIPLTGQVGIHIHNIINWHTITASACIKIVAITLWCNGIPAELWHLHDVRFSHGISNDNMFLEYSSCDQY